MILTLAVGYTVTKTYDLIRRADPNIISSEIANYYENDFEVNLLNSQQVFAVSTVGTDGLPKYDPQYVRMIARYDVKDEDGNWSFEDHTLHTCTEEDWAKFYDVE